MLDDKCDLKLTINGISKEPYYRIQPTGRVQKFLEKFTRILYSKFNLLPLSGNAGSNGHLQTFGLNMCNGRSHRFICAVTCDVMTSLSDQTKVQKIS